MILLADQKKETVQTLLEKYLMMGKPELGQVEKMGMWLEKKVNIENISQTKAPSSPSN